MRIRQLHQQALIRLIGLETLDKNLRPVSDLKMCLISDLRMQGVENFKKETRQLRQRRENPELTEDVGGRRNQGQQTITSYFTRISDEEMTGLDDPDQDLKRNDLVTSE